MSIIAVVVVVRRLAFNMAFHNDIHIVTQPYCDYHMIDYRIDLETINMFLKDLPLATGVIIT